MFTFRHWKTSYHLYLKCREEKWATLDVIVKPLEINMPLGRSIIGELKHKGLYLNSRVNEYLFFSFFFFSFCWLFKLHLAQAVWNDLLWKRFDIVLIAWSCRSGMINQYRMSFNARHSTLTWKLVAVDKAAAMINFFSFFAYNILRRMTLTIPIALESLWYAL